ncbi:MAG: hypothetical protein WCG03_05950 [Kiritimatiellales bacterium]
MIRIRYFAQKDVTRPAPYWQVGFRDPKDGFTFKPFIGHYSKFHAHDLAEKLNHAVDEFIATNEMPKPDDRLLVPKIVDPNNPLESEERLSKLAIWMSNTERLEEMWSGAVIDKISELKTMIHSAISYLKIEVQKDSAGNWYIRKR